MNVYAPEFYLSNDVQRSLTILDEDWHSTYLQTDYQITNAHSIFKEWNEATTLSALVQQWSTRHDILQLNYRISFSLLLYNISSLQAHFEDLIQYICSTYSTVWALTGLHFNEHANYQLASFFKSRYIIYFQRGTNPFGGVCLGITRELPHRLVPKFNETQNLIAIDFFNQNKRITLATIYSPPSEKLPVTMLDCLYQYNRNLILIGDFNARHFQWHDIITNAKGSQLDDWITEKENLRVYNSPQSTSTRSQAILDLIIAPQQLSSELTDADQLMHVTDHYPIHWNISSLDLNNVSQYELKKIDWALITCILDLKQNFFFNLAEQMKNEPTEFIIVYEKFLAALQERCTTYHRTRQYRPSLPPYFVNLLKQRRQILHLYRATQSKEHSALLSYLNRYIHYELRNIKKVQWQEYCLELEPKNTHRFWNHTKRLFKKRQHRIQGFIDNTTDHVLTESSAMLQHASEYYSNAFKEIDTSLQSKEVDEFKRHWAERLLELPSKPFLFKINDLTKAFRRLKIKTSSGHDKVSNKLLMLHRTESTCVRCF